MRKWKGGLRSEHEKGWGRGNGFAINEESTNGEQMYETGNS